MALMTDGGIAAGRRMSTWACSNSPAIPETATLGRANGLSESHVAFSRIWIVAGRTHAVAMMAPTALLTEVLSINESTDIL